MATTNFQEKITTTPLALKVPVSRKNRLPAIPTHLNLLNTEAEIKSYIQQCSKTPRKTLEYYANMWLKPEVAKSVLLKMDEDLSNISTYILALAAYDILSSENGSIPSQTEWTDERVATIKPALKGFGTVFANMTNKEIHHELFEVALIDNAATNAVYSMVRGSSDLLAPHDITVPISIFLCLSSACSDIRISKERHVFTEQEIKSKKPRRRCPISGHVFRTGDTAIELYFMFQVILSNPAMDSTTTSTESMTEEAAVSLEEEEGEIIVRSVWIYDGFMPGWMCSLPPCNLNLEGIANESKLKSERHKAAKRAETDKLTVMDAVACLRDLTVLGDWINDRFSPELSAIKQAASCLLITKERERKEAWTEAKKRAKDAKEQNPLAEKRKASKVDRKYHQLRWVIGSEEGIGRIVSIIHEIEQLQIMFLHINMAGVAQTIKDRNVRKAAAKKRNLTIAARKQKLTPVPVVTIKKKMIKVKVSTSAGPWIKSKRKRKHHHSSNKKTKKDKKKNKKKRKKEKKKKEDSIFND